MAKYKSIVVTNAGLELIAAAQSGDTIEFTAMKTGAGIYDGTEVLSESTGLKELKQTFGVTGITRDDTVIKVRSVIDNGGLDAGYNITEIGLFAKDKSGNEILYAIVVAETGLEDYLPAYADAPTTVTVEMHIDVSSVDSSVVFQATAIEGTYVTVQDFEDYKKQQEQYEGTVDNALYELNRKAVNNAQSATNAWDKAQQTAINLENHTRNKVNPHNVTAEQVGLGNVNNTSDEDKPVSKAQQTALNLKAERTEVIVDNIIDSNFNQGWVRCASYNYESGKATLTKSNDTSGISYFCKDYYLPKGETFTVSAFVKTSNINYKGFISISYRNDTTFVTLANSENTNDGKCEVTFTVPENANYVRVMFALFSSATEGTEIVFTNMMLENGAVAHSYHPYRYGLNRVCERVETILDNLLPYPYYDTTKTVNGVVCTDNGDGSITFSGTATADVTFLCSSRLDTTEPFKLPAGTYILTGCPDGGTDLTYKTTIGKTVDGAYKAVATSYGEGVEFTLTEETVLQISPVIKKGATVNNLTFTPVIRNVINNNVLREDLDTLTENVDTLMEDTGWVCFAKAGSSGEFTIDEDICYRIIGNRIYFAGTISYSGGAGTEGTGLIFDLPLYKVVIPRKSERVIALNLSGTISYAFSISVRTLNFSIDMKKNVASDAITLRKCSFEECFLLD